MTNRNEDAVNIQDACNPSGVAHTIAKHFSELLSQGYGTSALCEDAAMRLMVMKLSDLMGLQVNPSNFSIAWERNDIARTVNKVYNEEMQRAHQAGGDTNVG